MIVVNSKIELFAFQPHGALVDARSSVAVQVVNGFIHGIPAKKCFDRGLMSAGACCEAKPSN